MGPLAFGGNGSRPEVGGRYLPTRLLLDGGSSIYCIVPIGLEIVGFVVGEVAAVGAVPPLIGAGPQRGADRGIG